MTTKILIAVLAALSGAAFWFLAEGATVWSLGIISLWGFISLVIYLALLGLAFMFLSPRYTVGIIFLSALPMVYFLENKLLGVAIAAGLAILTFPPAIRIKKEMDFRLSFSAWDILRKGFPTFLTILALALAAFFYPQNNAMRFEDIIPESVFKTTLSVAKKSLPLSSVLPFDLPDPEKTVNEVLKEAISLEAGVDFKDIPQEEQERILAEARLQLARNFGVERVDGDDKVGDALYRGSIGFIEERFGAYRRYLPAVFALAVFAAFRTLFVFVGLLSIALVWIIIRILLYTGALAISERQVSQEFIEFK